MKYLGEGSFGQVIKAQNLHTGQIVAIKFINNIFRDLYHAKKVVREIEILRHMTIMDKSNQFTTKLVDLVVPVKTQDQIRNFTSIFLIIDFVKSDIRKLLSK